MTASFNDLPSSVTSYKPQILKIKIAHFRSWIEKRLTELLEGLEDEILWGLVFNYLEDAQKRSKREGPAANPSGGLSAKEIQTALSGFLGPKLSRDFTTELFTLLAEAEVSDTGIPPKFNMNPQEAEKEAFGIIQTKRREMELSDRVRREITRNDYHNNPRNNRDRDHNHRERNYNHRERDFDRKERDHEHRNYSHRHRSYSRSPENLSRDMNHLKYDNDHRRDRYDSKERGRYHRDRRRDEDYDRDDRRRDYRHRDNYSRSHDSIHRHPPSKSPIPSSSPESPSPCWETTLETSKVTAPRAPNVQENVSNELEMALKARALKALAEKRE